MRFLVLDDDQVNATIMMLRVIGHDNCEWTINCCDMHYMY
jgi:hypothetical protein